MATKNLARTVIEGGRYYHNAWFRRHSSKVERAKVRQCLSTIRSDILLWEETVLPTREPVCKLFRDKLSPAYRFLSSRAGKPWNETHALLRQRFDDRASSSAQSRLSKPGHGSASPPPRARPAGIFVGLMPHVPIVI